MIIPVDSHKWGGGKRMVTFYGHYKIGVGKKKYIIDLNTKELIDILSEKGQDILKKYILDLTASSRIPLAVKRY